MKASGRRPRRETCNTWTVMAERRNEVMDMVVHMDTVCMMYTKNVLCRLWNLQLRTCNFTKKEKWKLFLTSCLRPCWSLRAPWKRGNARASAGGGAMRSLASMSRFFSSWRLAATTSFSWTAEAALRSAFRRCHPGVPGHGCLVQRTPCTTGPHAWHRGRGESSTSRSTVCLGFCDSTVRQPGTHTPGKPPSTSGSRHQRAWYLRTARSTW